MGREIRRVPPSWEHPKTPGDWASPGEYFPLLDETLEGARREWLEDCARWLEGGVPSSYIHIEHPEELLAKYPRTVAGYIEMGHPFPTDKDGEYRRPEYTEEATAYQIYENVSEGTPMSPVFPTEDEMLRWLIGQGYSEYASRSFIKSGYAPSFIFDTRTEKMYENIHGLDEKV